MRMWGGRFDDEPDPRMADFTRSIEVDAELALDDIAGSIAHVRGLGRAGLLTGDEVATLEGGLASLRHDVEAGAIAWDPVLEDVHLNLETLLTARVGAVGGKLHTGRSRNDQVADRPAPVDPPCDRPARRRDRRARAGAGRPRRARRRRRPARARRTSSPPSPSCSPTTCSPTSRCSSATAAASPTRAAGSTSRRSGPARSPARAIPWTARRRPPSSASTASRANSLDAVSDRDFVVEVLAAAALAMVHLSPPRGGDHLVVEPAVRVRARRRRVLDGLVDDAQQEEPRPGGARPRPHGRGHRGADRRCSPCSRACRSRTSATSRRTSRRCSARSPRSRRRWASWPASSRPSRSIACGCARPPRRATRPPRRSPTSLVRRGVPFRAAHHIVGGLVGGAEAERIPSLAALPDEAYRAALDGSDDPVARGLAREKGVAAALREAATDRGRARSRRRHRRDGAGTRGAGPGRGAGASRGRLTGHTARPGTRPSVDRPMADARADRRGSVSAGRRPPARTSERPTMASSWTCTTDSSA